MVLYAALIFAVSAFSWHIPLVENAEKIHLDWFVHAVEYSVFGFLLSDALVLTFKRGSGWTVFAAALFLGALYGCLDEFHQSFVPYRDVCVSDALVDTIGVSLGIWIWQKRERKST